MEEEPSLQALVKELASTVKTLQGEVSELRKEKAGAVDAPCRANKRTREDEDVITEAKLSSLAMARSARKTVGKATPRAIPLRRTRCQLKVRPS